MIVDVFKILPKKKASRKKSRSSCLLLNSVLSVLLDVIVLKSAEGV